ATTSSTGGTATTRANSASRTCTYTNSGCASWTTRKCSAWETSPCSDNAMSHIKHLLIGSCLLLGLQAAAQDPQLSQFYAAPLYLNPALTGNTYQDRAGINYRMQWPGIGPGYKTYAVTYDHRSAEMHSGIGGMVMHDRSGSFGLSFTQAALSYSYEARLNRRPAVRGGLRGGYTMRPYDPRHMPLADQALPDHAPNPLAPP